MTTDRLAALLHDIDLEARADKRLVPKLRGVPRAYWDFIAARLCAAGVTVAAPYTGEHEPWCDYQSCSCGVAVTVAAQPCHWPHPQVPGLIMRSSDCEHAGVTVAAQQGWTCNNCANNRHDECKGTMGRDTCGCSHAQPSPDAYTLHEPVIREDRDGPFIECSVKDCYADKYNWAEIHASIEHIEDCGLPCPCYERGRLDEIANQEGYEEMNSI